MIKSKQENEKKVAELSTVNQKLESQKKEMASTKKSTDKMIQASKKNEQELKSLSS